MATPQLPRLVPLHESQSSSFPLKPVFVWQSDKLHSVPHHIAACGEIAFISFAESKWIQVYDMKQQSRLPSIRHAAGHVSGLACCQDEKELFVMVKDTVYVHHTTEPFGLKRRLVRRFSIPGGCKRFTVVEKQLVISSHLDQHIAWSTDGSVVDHNPPSYLMTLSRRRETPWDASVVLPEYSSCVAVQSHKPPLYKTLMNTSFLDSGIGTGAIEHVGSGKYVMRGYGTKRFVVMKLLQHLAISFFACMKDSRSVLHRSKVKSKIFDPHAFRQSLTLAGMLLPKKQKQF